MEETNRPWTQCLDLVTLHMRITPNAGTGLTPFEILHGRQLRLPPLEPMQTETDDFDLIDHMRKTLMHRDRKTTNQMPDSLSPNRKRSRR